LPPFHFPVYPESLLNLKKFPPSPLTILVVSLSKPYLLQYPDTQVDSLPFGFAAPGPAFVKRYRPPRLQAPYLALMHFQIEENLLGNLCWSFLLVSSFTTTFSGDEADVLFAPPHFYNLFPAARSSFDNSRFKSKLLSVFPGMCDLMPHLFPAYLPVGGPLLVEVLILRPS